MNDDARLAADGKKKLDKYNPPTITHLGTVAELTQKTVGADDGTVFLGLAIGSL